MDVERAVQGFGSSAQIRDAVARRIARRAADPIVDDLDAQRIVAGVDIDLHGGRPSVLGDIGESLADDSEQLVGQLIVDRRVNRAVNRTPGSNPSVRSASAQSWISSSRTDPSGQSYRVQVEDRPTYLADGCVEIVDRHRQACARNGRVGDELDRCLEAEADGEQALNHCVVQVARDPLAIGDRGQVGDLGVQASVVDRDPCRGPRARLRVPRRSR